MGRQENSPWSVIPEVGVLPTPTVLSIGILQSVAVKENLGFSKVSILMAECLNRIDEYKYTQTGHFNRKILNMTCKQKDYIHESKHDEFLQANEKKFLKDPAL